MFAMLAIPAVLLLKVRTATKIGRGIFKGIVWKEATVKVQVNFHKIEGIPDNQRLQRGLERIPDSMFARSDASQELYLPVMPLELLDTRYIGPDGREISEETARKYLPPRKPSEEHKVTWFCYKLSSILSMKPA